MSEKFDELLHTKMGALAEARKKIDDAIGDAHDSEQEDECLYDDSIFAQTVAGWLSDQSIVQLPLVPKPDEYFCEHRYSGKIGNAQISCWGSAILRTPGGEGCFDLHLFLSDYEKTNGFREITQEDFSRMHRQLLHFYVYACSGKLQARMNVSHPAYKYVQQIKRLHDDGKISSVRLWLLTNGVFPGGERNDRRAQGDEEWSAQLVDLVYISDLFSSGVDADQSFENIGGLQGIKLGSNAEQDYDCILSVIPGETLSTLYSLHGPALVRANVRAYLGEKVNVNKGIYETIVNEPSRFLAYNNGLVLSCRAADFHDGRLWKLYGIQIINGGQTTASIYHAWLRARRNRKDPEARNRLEANLKKMYVPMKVVISREGATEKERAEFRVRISEAANSQNAVRRSDLEANSPFQVEFSSKVNSMRTPDGISGWFYENARGLYEAEKSKCKNRRELADFKARYPESKKFDKTQFAMAYLACEGRAQDCAKGREVAFGIFCGVIDELYEQHKMTLDPKTVQELVARWILFDALEKSLKKKGLKNPRITMLYTLAMLHEKMGTRVQWGKIWQMQKPTEAFLRLLVSMAGHVDRIIRDNMGGAMIHMYGRQAECLRVVQNGFSNGILESKSAGIAELPAEGTDEEASGSPGAAEAVL